MESQRHVNAFQMHACLESILTYDGELFRPLAETFLAQQEGTDATVPGRRHGALIRGPLVSELHTGTPLLLVLLIGFIGTAQSVRVVVWGSNNFKYLFVVE